MKKTRLEYILYELVYWLYQEYGAERACEILETKAGMGKDEIIELGYDPEEKEKEE